MNCNGETRGSVVAVCSRIVDRDAGAKYRAQGGTVIKSVRLWGWAVGFKTVGGSTNNNCGTIEKNNCFYFRYRITLHTVTTITELWPQITRITKMTSK